MLESKRKPNQLKLHKNIFQIMNFVWSKNIDLTLLLVPKQDKNLCKIMILKLYWKKFFFTVKCYLLHHCIQNGFITSWKIAYNWISFQFKIFKEKIVLHVWENGVFIKKFVKINFKENIHNMDQDTFHKIWTNEHWYLLKLFFALLL